VNHDKKARVIKVPLTLPLRRNALASLGVASFIVYGRLNHPAKPWLIAEF
jgi:hypothetical protein